VAWLVPAPLHAQSTAGSIVGGVADEQGGSLPGVTLTARNTETGVARNAVSDGNGRYRLIGLPPGPYDVTAELQGFTTARVEGLTLTIGLEVIQDLTLALQSLQETIVVSGASPIIDTTKAEVASVVTQQQIDSLPIEGRSAITLSLLLPGTSTDTTRAQRPGANVGIGGMTTAATNYIVDGLNNMISRAGDAREDLPQSAIQEFKVHLTQTPAEYGGRSGGVVSVVTRSGTNRLSGEAVEFFRDKALNTFDKFQQERHEQFGDPAPDFRRNQYGLAVGGPIVRDRVHFFASIERTRTQESFTVATGRPEFYGSQEGTFERPSFANTAFVKGTASLGPRQTATFRYSRQASTQYCQNCGGNAASFGTDNSVPGFTYFAGHTWQLSDRVFNDFAILYAESNQTTDPSSRYTPAGISTAVGSARYVFPSFSWGASPGTSFNNVYEQFRDALSISLGRHLVKVGGGVQILPTYMRNPGSPLGTWTFGADQYFNPADPSFSFAGLRSPIQFTASLPAFSPENLSHTYEAYAQDEWRLGRVTLNLGVRYDLQTKIWNEDFSQSRYPRPLPYVDFASRGDTNNVGPRLGLAWDVRGTGRTIVRGGYGLVYGNMQNSLGDGEINAFQQYSVNIRNPLYPDPYQGRDPLSFVSTAPPNITILANDLENAESHSTTAGVSQQIGADLSLHVDGVYSTTTKFPVRVNVNTPDPVSGVRPLPDWGNIIQQQRSNGTYDYRALLVRLDKRFATRTQYTLSYTLSAQTNDWTGTSGNGYGAVTDIFDPGLDHGPADVDRRHAFVASGAVLLPARLTLGAVWAYRSSAPFSALAGRDLNRDGSNSDYVPGTTRNQGNRDLDLSLVNAWRASNGLGPIAASQIDSNRYSRLDVRLSKAIAIGGQRRIELIGQVFNLLGTDDLGGVGTGWVTNALSDSFGRILTALPRQQGELAVKLVF
jgi:outer membrane receptor protein involved in Fe transport